MTGAWFRMYDELLDDPKVQRLPPADFKGWVNLLTLANRYGGKLPPIGDVAFALRETDDATLTLVERLLNAGLIDRVNGGVNGYVYAMHGWLKRQYKSDTSTLRVKRFRKRCRNAKETASESETESETDKTPLSPKGDVPPFRGTVAVSVPFREAVEVWNVSAAAYGLPLIQRLTKARQAKLGQRLRECGGIEGWRAALAMIEHAGFLRGDNDRGWKADFDFVLQETSFAKLVEGGYNSTAPPKLDYGQLAFDTLAAMTDAPCQQSPPETLPALPKSATS